MQVHRVILLPKQLTLRVRLKSLRLVDGLSHVEESLSGIKSCILVDSPIPMSPFERVGVLEGPDKLSSLKKIPHWFLLHNGLQLAPHLFVSSHLGEHSAHPFLLDELLSRV